MYSSLLEYSTIPPLFFQCSDIVFHPGGWYDLGTLTRKEKDDAGSGTCGGRWPYRRFGGPERGVRRHYRFAHHGGRQNGVQPSATHRVAASNE